MGKTLVLAEKTSVGKDIAHVLKCHKQNGSFIEGFKNLKPGNQYDNLYRVAVYRAEGDWLVGLNVTRALTCKYNA